MGTMTGMDIGAVKALAKELKSSSGEINGIIKKLNSKLESAQWVGNDQKKFVNDWKGNQVPALKKVVAVLEQASNRADQNAREQEQASNR